MLYRCFFKTELTPYQQIPTHAQHTFFSNNFSFKKPNHSLILTNVDSSLLEPQTTKLITKCLDSFRWNEINPPQRASTTTLPENPDTATCKKANT